MNITNSSIILRVLHQFTSKYYLFALLQRRCITTSSLINKVVPNNVSGKGKSSDEWLTRQLNDVYVKKSRYDRYRCRSAYKLLEIDEKYKILKPGYSVVDCGAAPGSWTQVVVKKLKLDQDSEDNKSRNGVVIAVDLQYLNTLKGATVLRELDFTDPAVQDKICRLLPDGKVDVVLSDMAPRASGTTDLDTVAIMSLAHSALMFAARTLKKDGTFLCKVWDSSEVEGFARNLEKLFMSIKRIKPKASRLDSSELYLLARGYKNVKFLNKG